MRGRAASRCREAIKGLTREQAISRSEIAAIADCSKSTVAVHLDRLASIGHVGKVYAGRNRLVRYYDVRAEEAVPL